MLAEDTLFLDYLTYGGGAVGIGLVLVGLFRSHLRVLIIAGLALPSAMVGIDYSQKVPLMFDVVVVEQPDGNISWRKVTGFVGGSYTFGDGSSVSITKPEGGPIGTVVVNDSDRRLRIIRVTYGSKPRLPGPGGRDEVAVIDPRKTGATLERVEHFGAESEGPPPSMMSVSSFDTLDWLAW